MLSPGSIRGGFLRCGLRGAVVCLVIATCLAGLLAQDAANDNGEASTMFRMLDANKDGRLMLDEAGPATRSLMENVFNMSGKPRGSALSRADFQQVFDKHKAASGGRNGSPMPRPDTPSGPGQRPPSEDAGSDANGLPPLLAQLDDNADGRLTRTELQRLMQMFERLDANKDGALSADELRSAASLPKPDAKPKTATPAPKSSGRGTSAKSTGSGSASPSGSGNRASGRPPTEKASDDTDDKPAEKAADKTAKKSTGNGANRSLPAGVWRGWVVNGRGENPNSGQMELELTVEGNRIIGREVGTRRAPEGIGGGTFIITGDGKSGNLDAEGTSGPQDGRSFLGVYEFDGEVLRWCVSNRGRQRPQTMATDRGNYLMVLRQQK